MLPQISALSTSLIDYLRKTEFPSLASKPVLLAGFILSDLDSGHLLDRCILTSVIRTILFLSGPGPAVPNPGQLTKCSRRFANSHLYRTNLCELAVLDAPWVHVFSGNPSAQEDFCGKN